MPAPRMYKTEAIVFASGGSARPTAFSRSTRRRIGKMDVKARGVRKTTSRMSGHLQPLTRCVLQLAQGHVSDVVAGCETLESFQPLRDDLERLSRALYAAELIDRMVPERVHSFPTYRLLVETLRRLADAEDQDQVLRFFEMRLVDQCGFRPELENVRRLRVGAGAGRELLRAVERRSGLPGLRRRPDRDAGAFGERAQGVAPAPTRVV